MSISIPSSSATQSNSQTISLLQYLQAAHAPIPVYNSNEHLGRVSPNTRSGSYSYMDIETVSPWPEFGLEAIMQEYGHVLQEVRIQDDPFPNTPPRPVHSEQAIYGRLWEYLGPRVRRSLRSGFEYLRRDGRMQGRSEVWWDCGNMSKIEKFFRPDLTFHEAPPPGQEPQNITQRPNRLPGDIKPSEKWKSTFQASQNHRLVEEFKQVLSQVNWYMRQNDAQYGYILTDLELVAVKRLDRNWKKARMFVSRPIPWAASGTANQPQLTVLLALWYLGMLASKDIGNDPSWSFPLDAAPEPVADNRRSARPR